MYLMISMGFSQSSETKKQSLRLITTYRLPSVSAELCTVDCFSILYALGPLQFGGNYWTIYSTAFV